MSWSGQSLLGGKLGLPEFGFGIHAGLGFFAVVDRKGGAQMKELTIGDIFAVEDKKLEQLVIEEWGGCIYIRIMSATERSELEDIYMTMKKVKTDTGKFRKEMLRRTVSDKDGVLLLSDDATANHVMGKSSLVIETIFEKACELNGFRESDVDAIKKK